MKTLNKNIAQKVERPIKIVQFGEGNFLRGFVDYMVDVANEKGYFDGNIAIVKPIPHGSLESFHNQDCNYTVLLRGQENGEKQVIKRIVTSVSEAVEPFSEYDRYVELAKLDSLRFIVSNTTEAGIVYDDSDRYELNPPKTYPGKLTKFLHDRFKHFNGDSRKGLVILPVELIDDNGVHLKDAVLKLSNLWGLGEDFIAWLNEACIFGSTLVDRIVTGFPKDEADELWNEFGYRDELLVTGEPFALWVIETDKPIEDELPLHKAGLQVVFTDNHKPYKQRKVRILNGAHTSFSLASYLAGNDYVGESMKDEDISSYIRKTIFDEIIPTINLPMEDLVAFADAVKDRFENPFIKHALLSISLNSVSKWRARCLPSLLDYVDKFSKLPNRLTFSLAALLQFYTGTEVGDGVLVGHRGDNTYEVKDNQEILEFFAAKSTGDIEQFVTECLASESFWGQDLTKVAGLKDTVLGYLKDIRAIGIRETIKKL